MFPGTTLCVRYIFSPWNNVPTNYSVCKNKNSTSGVDQIVLNWKHGFNGE